VGRTCYEPLVSTHPDTQGKGNVLDVGKGFFTLSADMGRLDVKADDVTRTVFLGREIEAAHEKFGGR
jgi:hypothetical protein